VRNTSKLKRGALLSATPLLFTALCACGRQSPATQPTVAKSAAPSVCARDLLPKAELAAVLKAPITGQKPIAGDPQSCEYTTAGFSGITISVRPGLGGTTVDAWATGKMPLEVQPLSNVGDRAVWQDTLHELIAQQHNLLCDIQVRGSGQEIAVAADALPQAVGKLCDKIFAAY
jgi:hypothetical protein